MKAIQSVRGMKDIFGAEAQLFQSTLKIIETLFHRYQFELILLPIIEKTELFSRSIGDATDVVEKEMYTFQDRNEDSLSLRPEGTAGCVRACLENGLIHNQVRKFWYVGPMFRHERPQKGRYRQFYQVGVEVFGLATPDIEAETLLLLQDLWTQLGISEHIRLEINTIGTLLERKIFRQKL
ncbi:MAG: ATP phosphoribosyltransferase regulatory subunit, partial [Gammaproteobacteria bacterium]|nr:ATP phosphoribosyltransferase regulatory subunit [Gammaproteobacteria bacterium]